jgi:ribosomal protein S6--L-glutamate ligase
MNPNNKHVIGCDEWLSLSELGIPAIKARIDSGAKTSAIHAYNIQTYRKDNALWVNFEVLGLDVAGVDLIRSNKGPLLLEVNASPGLEGIEDATGKDIARDIIIAIEKKLGWTIPSV